jgi:hypothetical protein
MSDSENGDFSPRSQGGESVLSQREHEQLERLLGKLGKTHISADVDLRKLNTSTRGSVYGDGSVITGQNKPRHGDESKRGSRMGSRASSKASTRACSKASTRHTSPNGRISRAEKQQIIDAYEEGKKHELMLHSSERDREMAREYKRERYQVARKSEREREQTECNRYYEPPKNKGKTYKMFTHDRASGTKSYMEVPCNEDRVTKINTKIGNFEFSLQN